MENILFVCHSTGDTNACLAVANSLLQNELLAINFLVVGQAAKNIIAKHPLTIEHKLNVSYLSDIFDESTMKRVENDALNNNEIEVIKQYLLKLNINKVFIGTPSLLKTKVPFQVAQCIAEHIEFGAIFNDYLFYEKDHVFWEQLDVNKEWNKKFTWFMPLPTATKMIQQKNPSLDTASVGHPIFDQLKASSIDKKAIRDNLNVKESRALLFISATKELADDRDLLTSILESLEKTDTNVEILWGIHPGTANMQEYIDGLVNELQNHESTKIANKIKFILTDSVAQKLNQAELEEQWFIRKNITSDTAAADGVACSVPATFVNHAALMGKAAYYHQSDKEPYLPKSALQVGKDNLGTFFKRVVDSSKPEALTHDKLGVFEGEFSTSVTNIMYSSRRV